MLVGGFQGKDNGIDTGRGYNSVLEGVLASDDSVEE